MTSISNVTGYDASSYLSAIKSTNSTGSSSVGSDTDTDEDSSTQATSGHHHRGGGGMGKALMETMQQLGMTPPAPPADAADASSSSDSSATPATGDLQSDFGSFMSQLFQALQSESGTSSGNGTGDGSSSSPGGRFAAALSSLTTDAANGSAPDGLQSAYTQLMQDLQGGTGTSTNSDAGSSSTSTPDLQAFLSTLQQNLAQYGQHQMAVGNVVSTQA